MTMKQISFLIITFLFISNSFGQLTPKRTLEFPIKYRQPINEYDYLPASSDSVESGTAWMVLSDRDNNETSKDPDGDGGYKTLRFLEIYFVIEEKGEYVRIVKDPGISSLDLSANFIPYGWIHKSKLIMWTTCLKTPKARIARKAMVLNTVSEIKKKSGKPDLVEFKKGPEESSRNSGFTSRLFQFFFVMKTDTVNDMVLLSKSPDIPMEDE